MPISKIQQIKNKIEDTKQLLTALNEELRTAYGDSYWKCTICEARTKVKLLACVDVYWYNAMPYVEDWVSSHSRITCPKCKGHTKIYKPTPVSKATPEYKWLQEAKKSFRMVSSERKHRTY